MYYNSDNIIDNKMNTKTSFFPTFDYTPLLVFFNAFMLYFENAYNTVYRLFSIVANELSGINNIWCIKKQASIPIPISQYSRDERSNIQYYYDSSVKYLMLANTYFSKMYFTNDDYCSLKKMSIFIKVGDKEYFLDEWLRDFKFETDSSNEMISPWLLLNLWSLYSNIWVSYADNPVITVIGEDGDIIEFDLVNMDYKQWDMFFLGYEEVEEVEEVEEKVEETVEEKVEETVEVEKVEEKVEETVEVEKVEEKVEETVEVEKVEEKIEETVEVEKVEEKVEETVEVENIDVSQVTLQTPEINNITSAANAINSVEKVIQQLRQVEEETKRRNEERRMNEEDKVDCENKVSE
jgi:hypothetical protein